MVVDVAMQPIPTAIICEEFETIDSFLLKISRVTMKARLNNVARDKPATVETKECTMAERGKYN